ncbi:hypothetical protein BRC92_12945 [Halobacteriales archaeon QS_4_69_31]|jgi:CheY-like chemotaxis protein|nr:MAG: hypothetical protein BRC92_12945 [Halobacteriales archaeon QS_4_69_31]
MGSVRVLVVDEDRDVVDLAQSFLEREEPTLEVETATSASAALDRVERSSVDVVVSDFQMPEMDGLELADAVHERAPDLPYVLYTARHRSSLEDAVGDRVAGYVQKGTGREQYAELASLIDEVT